MWFLLLLDAIRRHDRPCVDFDSTRHCGLRTSSNVVSIILAAYLFTTQIVYLVYLVAGEHKTIPQLSLIMIAAIYGLQALVFILRRKWDMIGWMIFYIIAIPAFSFFLPLYSFWRMDDFSWGQTRVVMGESGKKMIIHVSLTKYTSFHRLLIRPDRIQDEGKFDPRSIPLKSWQDYVSDLLTQVLKLAAHPLTCFLTGKRVVG
jgi:hypothetical protein